MFDALKLLQVENRSCKKDRNFHTFKLAWTCPTYVPEDLQKSPCTESSSSLRNPSNGRMELTSKIFSAHNFGHDAKNYSPCMEKLSCVMNFQYEVKKSFFGDSVRCTQKKTKILKTSMLDHMRACDKSAVTTVNVTKHSFGYRICPNISLNHARDNCVINIL